MTLSERSLLRLHLIGMLAMILLLSAALGGYFLYQQQKQFHADSRQMELQNLRTAQANLTGSLDTLNHYLQQNRQRADIELRRELHHLVLSAWSLTDSIYQRHKDDWPAERIISQVRELISRMRFPYRHGYYFINSVDDRVILNPRSPELEGTPASAVLDDRGQSIGRILQQAVDNPRNEGYTQYRWKYPGSDSIQDKISFVRLYAPLGLLIGTGDYVEVFEQRLQQESLQMLASTRIGADGYFAVLDASGTLLLSPGMPEAQGRPLHELPDLARQGLQSILDTSARGGGFVRYQWPKGPGLPPQDKLSLVSNFAPWGWILVSGVYLGDMQQELAVRQQELHSLRQTALWSSLTILTLIMLVAITFSVLYSRWLEERFGHHRASLARTRQQMQQLRETDHLTSLPNQHYLARHLRRRLGHTSVDSLPLAMLSIDLDHFKNINDALGHETGDALLIAVSRRLKACLGSGDLLCRHGGDEFMILLDGRSALDSGMIAELAQGLLNECQRPFQIGAHPLNVTLSIGIACWPIDGDNLHSLRQSAEIAMYQAKQQGRNQFCFASQEHNQQVREQLELETGLRRALDGDELRLVYQPKVDLRTGQLAGCEALMRWRSPALGEVSPVRFIPVAEQADLIGALGRWALEAACRQARAWLDAGLPPLRIAVNVSARQFSQNDLPAQVAAALQHYRLPASALELELTESVLAEDFEQLQQVLHQLRDMGIHLTMDDFGTGYSSLSYLNQFRLDTLKIDRSFITDLERNSEHRELTSAILAMASSLGMACVAEGVESEGQWRWLLGQACRYGQGYLFARPLEAEALAKLLAGSDQPLHPLPASSGIHAVMDL